VYDITCSFTCNLFGIFIHHCQLSVTEAKVKIVDVYTILCSKLKSPRWNKVLCAFGLATKRFGFSFRGIIPFKVRCRNNTKHHTDPVLLTREAAWEERSPCVYAFVCVVNRRVLAIQAQQLSTSPGKVSVLFEPHERSYGHVTRGFKEKIRKIPVVSPPRPRQVRIPSILFRFKFYVFFFASNPPASCRRSLDGIARRHSFGLLLSGVGSS